MKVQIVSFSCVLKNKLGRIISSTVNRDVLTNSLNEGDQLPALADKMQNLKAGEKRRIILGAAEAYGFYDPKLAMTVPRKSLPQVSTQRGPNDTIVLPLNGKAQSFRVIKVTDDEVTLDGNHPLAGQDLVFEIEAFSVRDATPEEISQSLISMDTPLYH
jgi:FKBP-type peptidyl-prolyl cis-trans isomerase SlyD